MKYQKAKFKKQRFQVMAHEPSIPNLKIFDEFDILKSYEVYELVVNLMFDAAGNQVESKEIEEISESCRDIQKKMLDGMNLLRLGLQGGLAKSERLIQLTSDYWSKKTKEFRAASEKRLSAEASNIKK